jgi:hypothetical protein
MHLVGPIIITFMNIGTCVMLQEVTHNLCWSQNENVTCKLDILLKQINILNFRGKKRNIKRHTSYINRILKLCKITGRPIKFIFVYTLKNLKQVLDLNQQNKSQTLLQIQESLNVMDYYSAVRTSFGNSSNFSFGQRRHVYDGKCDKMMQCSVPKTRLERNNSSKRQENT